MCFPIFKHNSNLLFETVDITLEWNDKNLPGWPSGVTKASVRDLVIACTVCIHHSLSCNRISGFIKIWECLVIVIK